MLINLLFTAFRETHRDFGAVWKRGWKVFVGCAVLLEINHALMDYVGTFFDAEMGPKLADAIASIVASGTYILIIPIYALDVRRGNLATNFWAHTKKHFNLVMIEMLRVVAKVLLGLLIGVVPAVAILIAFSQFGAGSGETARIGVFALAAFALLAPVIVLNVRLTFVPFIAQFDPVYLAGKVDALKRSESMVKGRFWPIFSILLVVFVLSLLETFKYVKSFDSPLFYLMAAANVFLQVYVYTFFFSVYEHLAPAPTETGESS